MVLGVENNDDNDDIDIATNAKPSAIASLFKKVVRVGEHFGVMIVIEKNIPFEVATFRADKGISDGRHPQEVVFSDAQTDAQRRDFTINGLFYDPVKKEILDYVNGREDSEKGIIRTISVPQLRFEEDYLRLLRAVRFAARFSFTIEPATFSALKHNAGKISCVSAERIFQELNKMVMGPNPEVAFSLLEKSGLLAVILPEIQALKGVEQPKPFHPEGDVLSHTIKTLSYLRSPSQTLAWSALLHDIGKPATQSRTDRIRFNNHSRISAIMAKKILMRLKSSRALINTVYDCIDNHMNFINVTRMRLSTLKKFLCRPTFEDELELHRADCLASHGNIENYDFLRKKRGR
jgi:poly(A) polymerase